MDFAFLLTCGGGGGSNNNNKPAKFMAALLVLVCFLCSITLFVNLLSINVKMYVCIYTIICCCFGGRVSCGKRRYPCQICQQDKCQRITRVRTAKNCLLCGVSELLWARPARPLPPTKIPGFNDILSRRKVIVAYGKVRETCLPACLSILPLLEGEWWTISYYLGASHHTEYSIFNNTTTTFQTGLPHWHFPFLFLSLKTTSDLSYYAKQASKQGVQGHSINT